MIAGLDGGLLALRSGGLNEPKTVAAFARRNHRVGGGGQGDTAGRDDGGHERELRPIRCRRQPPRPVLQDRSGEMATGPEDGRPRPEGGRVGAATAAHVDAALRVEFEQGRRGIREAGWEDIGYVSTIAMLYSNT